MNLKDIINNEKEKKNDDEQLQLDIENKEEETIEDFFSTTTEDYDEFEEESWKEGHGLIAPHYPIFSEKMEGVSSGLYLFAGPPNHGKTAAMMNIAEDIAMFEENNSFMMCYSLDDSKKEIIPRLVAMEQEIPISVVAKPLMYQEKIDKLDDNSRIYNEWLEKRKKGLALLKQKVNRLKVEDNEKLKSLEDVKTHFSKLLIYLKAIDENYRPIMIIDSINDLAFKNKHFKSQEEKHSSVAQEVKDWSKEFNVPIFASTHIKKLECNRRPVLDDLRMSGEYAYEASVVFLVYNDVSQNKNNANVFLTENNEKKPVIELNWAKNKKSSYKGMTYVSFVPEYSKTIELNKEVSKQFDTIIFSM